MHTHDQFKVGPDGQGGYRYAFGNVLSADQYHNAESARQAARREQSIVGPYWRGLRPASAEELAHQDCW